MSSFNDFNLPLELVQGLTRMNYTVPTPVQEKAIPLALAGRDLIASAQTGTGKTGAFGIPLVAKLMGDPHSQALVLAPTRELAGQILVVLRQLSLVARHIDSVLLIGGVNMMRQKDALRRNPRIIVATPGRLVDHLERNKKLLSKVRFLVLDEADRMLDMGFAPQLRMIRQAIGDERQTLLFSATYPTDIAELAKAWLKDPERITIGSVSQPVSHINQVMVKLNGADKPTTVVKELAKREGSVLIFTRTKRRADRLTEYLKEKGLSACRIHSDRTQSQRQQALSGFREGKYRVLVATDIAARGIDVPHIEHVINFDLPMVADDYLHRIGRTGRAGKTGEALCLVSPEESKLWRSIERLMAQKNGLHSSEREKVSFNRGDNRDNRSNNNSGRGPRHLRERNKQSRGNKSRGDKRTGSRSEAAGRHSETRGQRSFNRSSDKPFRGSEGRSGDRHGSYDSSPGQRSSGQRSSFGRGNGRPVRHSRSPRVAFGS